MQILFRCTLPWGRIEPHFSFIIALIQSSGTICAEGLGHCHMGICGSHLAQCQLLWGNHGKVSDRRCFHLNTRGDVKVSLINPTSDEWGASECSLSGVL